VDRTGVFISRGGPGEGVSLSRYQPTATIA